MRKIHPEGSLDYYMFTNRVIYILTRKVLYVILKKAVKIQINETNNHYFFHILLHHQVGTAFETLHLLHATKVYLFCGEIALVQRPLYWTEVVALRGKTNITTGCHGRWSKVFDMLIPYMYKAKIVTYVIQNECY